MTEEKLFQHLLIYNSTRGLDSTGAGSVKRHEVNGVPRMVVAKELGHPFELLSIKRKGQDDIDTVLGATNKVLIGHCRAKTVGSHTRQNAHPFKFDNIMGTHNGTLSYQTQESLEGFKKFETDSQALFNEISEKGIADTVKKLRRPREDEREGFGWTDAYALVWYDARDNTINFLRNQERPLYYGWSKDKQRLFWSSDYGHLYTAMQSVPTDKEYIYDVKPDYHLSWVVPNHGQQFGKVHAVRREGTPDRPLGRGSVIVHNSRQHQNNGGGSTRNTDANTTDLYGLEPWMDEMTGFWCMFSKAKYRLVYANFKGGPYHDDKQSCWDALTKMEQESRIKRGLYPSGVNLYAKSADKLNDSLDNSEERISGYLPKTGRDVHSLKKQLREKRFTDEGHVRDENMIPIWEDESKKVYWDKYKSEWAVFVFKGFHIKPPLFSWEAQRLDTVPEWLPFTDHDIRARHFFKHKGKKGAKVPYFRGFRGVDLTEQEFTSKMDEGCLNCSRKPRWGNWVHFLDDKYFVCEFCERDTELVKSFKSGTKN